MSHFAELLPLIPENREIGAHIRRILVSGEILPERRFVPRQEQEFTAGGDCSVFVSYL